MKRKPLIATIILAGLGLVATTRPPAAQSYGNNRPVYVFAPSATTQFNAQVSALATAEARERDVVVIGVAGDKVSARLGPQPGASAASLRQRFGVAPDAFAVILVGKDGGVKLRSASPINVGRIFDLIDTMPMRRQEMQR